MQRFWAIDSREQSEQPKEQKRQALTEAEAEVSPGYTNPNPTLQFIVTRQDYPTIRVTELDA